MSTVDTSVPVVVLKIHHGSLGIARSLGRLGVAVYGLTASPGAPAARSRYWRACHQWDLEREPADRSLEHLIRIGRILADRPLLMPVSDLTALFVARHAHVLESVFRFPDVPYALAASLVDKHQMQALAKMAGVATPLTLSPRCKSDLLRFADDAGFPVVLKAIDGSRLKHRFSMTVALARNRAELLQLYEALETPEAPNVLLQEFIPGGEGATWIFNGCFDASSEPLAAFTGRKLRANPPATGAATLGVCARNDAVLDISLRLIKTIGYRGIIDIDYRYDERDSRYKVLDINPRIGSTFRLFTGSEGLDVARALYLNLTGQPVPASLTPHGRKWIVEDQDLESWRHASEDGLNLAAWIASLQGVREGAWFAADDLWPFLLICRRLGASAARLLAGRSSKPAVQFDHPPTR